jgi:hypothetical protein
LENQRGATSSFVFLLGKEGFRGDVKERYKDFLLVLLFFDIMVTDITVINGIYQLLHWGKAL